MSNTLISLLKEVKSRLSEISELKAEIVGKKSDINQLEMDIDSFAPKHLLGQELTIVLKPKMAQVLNSSPDSYRNNIMDLVNKGFVPRHYYYTKNVPEKAAGKKIKVVQIKLKPLITTQNASVLEWVITGLLQKNDGSYGLQQSEFILFDKVELTD